MYLLYRVTIGRVSGEGNLGGEKGEEEGAGRMGGKRDLGGVGQGMHTRERVEGVWGGFVGEV